ncbi:MAG: ankyrin repeat domain-containing protein [Myxacorys californica WJT36-NPBG1]|jgi:ankyrin repeat protein|nr:ankyrin repeat domain-containing protein [Myxacorys californica WJT36-NPBG1]
MKIHRYAERGDQAGVQQELMQGVSINEIDTQADSFTPQTPLQCAIASPHAGVNLVEFLIAQGAMLSLTPQQGKSDFMWAVHSGSIEKVQLLLDLGADIGEVDEDGYDALTNAMFSQAQAERMALVKFLIDKGAQLNGQSSYGESALSVASRCGWFDIVQMLLEAGGDCLRLGWTDLMQAVALGTLSDVKAQLEKGADLTTVDQWERTPWLLSLQVGEVSKAQRLLEAGSDPLAVGRCGKLPMMYALESGNLAMLKWLIELGLDINGTDEFGETALMLAAELDQVEAASLLLEAGVDVSQTTKYNGKAINKAHSLNMIERLVAVGEELADLDPSVRRLLTRVDAPDCWELEVKHYQAAKYPRFGNRNPEMMTAPFWREMVRFRGAAYAARAQYKDTSYRTEAAVWCFQRFGQTITILPDGRVIEIAGEHEDYYDPDFYIYNDVVVYDGHGDFQIYGYPRTIFPPTDFHTATWFDGWIYIIGNLGYQDDRIVGDTPVYRLNCTTFTIENVETHGESPGWLSHHRAVLYNRQIRISGGKVWATQQQDQPTLIDNDAQYVLNLEQNYWHRVQSEL